MGYSYREIGQGLGWSYTKVNRCVAEGRADLRRRLAADGD
jgi:DNA-directed RNA polymerase specialized sigma24 family protein